jgi:hypothetical protein
VPSHCLTDRATALVNAISKERHQNLSAVIQQIGAAMNSRGVLLSSIHVNEVSEACASELRNIAGLIWDNMKRAHESCGSKTSEDLLALFRMLLLAEKVKLEQVQEGAIGGIARQLQNQSLIPMHGVSEAYDDLLRRYRVEIEIYISNLQRGAGATIADRLRSRFMNNWVIAVGATVVAAIVFLAEFTDAIGKLSTFVKGVFGGG